jgi:hypothetical protein
MVSEAVRKKQRPKKGRVARLSPDLVRLVDLNRREGETVPDVLRRLIHRDHESEAKFALPSDLHETPEDARGAAIVRSVRDRSGRIERPIKVRTEK